MTFAIAMQNTDSPNAPLDRAVAAYADMVYASALRQTGDAHLAADITQSVFVVLAHRVASGKLPKEMHMAGWLLTAARYGVKEARRAAVRRHFHEQRAAALRAEIAADSPLPDTVLAEVDLALLELRASDRELVARRYLCGETVRAIASTLELRENTVGRRITRALEKMRHILARRGVAVPAATLTALLGDEAARRAPAAVTVATKGAASAQALLADLILRRMLMVKLQITAAVVTASLTLAAGGALITQVARQTPRPDATPLPVTAAAEQPGAGAVGPFTITTESAVAIQFVALAGGASPRTATVWWAPNGSPHAPVTLPAPVGGGMSGGGGGGGGAGGPAPGTYSICFDISQGTDDRRFIAYRITSNPVGGAYSGSIRSQLLPVIMSVRNNPDTADFHVDLTSGPWTNFVLHPGSAAPADKDAVAMLSLDAEGRAGDGFTQTIDNLDTDLQRLLITRDNGAERAANPMLRGRGDPARRFTVPGHPDEQFLAVRPFTLAIDFKNVSLRPGALTKVDMITKTLPDLPLREDLGGILKTLASGGDLKPILAPAADPSTPATLAEFRKFGDANARHAKELWVDGPRACAIIDQNHAVGGAADLHLGLMLVRTDKQWLVSRATLLRDDNAVSDQIHAFCNTAAQPVNHD